MTPRLRWASKSLVKLSGELREQGREPSPSMVRQLMYQAGWRLQSNSKSMARSAPHPDRSAQFGYISAQAGDFTAAGQPVVSVDTRKKEPAGNFAGGGRERAPATPARRGCWSPPAPAGPAPPGPARARSTSPRSRNAAGWT